MGMGMGMQGLCFSRPMPSSELILATFTDGHGNMTSSTFTNTTNNNNSNKNGNNNTTEDKGECHGCIWNIDTGLMLTANTFKELGKNFDLVTSTDNPHCQVGIVSCNPIVGCIYFHSLRKERPVMRSFGVGAVTCVTSSGNLLASGDSSGTIKVWNISTGEMIYNFCECHLQKINKVSFSRDGSLLVSSGSDAMINVFDLTVGKMIYTFKDHRSSVNDLYFGIGVGRSVRLLTGSDDHTCNLYDLVDGSLLASFTFPVSIMSVCMNFVENIIYAGGQNGTCYILELNQISNQTVQKIEISKENSINSILLTNDESKIILSSPDNKITIVDAEFRIIIRVLKPSNQDFINQRLTMIKLITSKNSLSDANEKLELKQLAKAKAKTIDDSNDKIMMDMHPPKRKSEDGTHISYDFVTKEYEKLKGEHEKLLQIHQKLLKTISK